MLVQIDDLMSVSEQFADSLAGGMIATPEFEILQPVIKPVPVPMVDGLLRSEQSTDARLNDQSVLTDVPLGISSRMVQSQDESVPTFKLRILSTKDSSRSDFAVKVEAPTMHWADSAANTIDSGIAVTLPIASLDRAPSPTLSLKSAVVHRAQPCCKSWVRAVIDCALTVSLRFHVSICHFGLLERTV